MAGLRDWLLTDKVPVDMFHLCSNVGQSGQPSVEREYLG